MSTVSTRVALCVLGGVSLLAVGWFTHQPGSSQPSYPQQVAYAPPQVVQGLPVEVVTQMMRTLADDSRRMLEQQATVNQKLLMEHAQASVRLLTQSGNHVEALVRSAQQQTQENNRQIAYLLERTPQQPARASYYSQPEPYYQPQQPARASYYQQQQVTYHPWTAEGVQRVLAWLDRGD